jgi:hypothetical protein
MGGWNTEEGEFYIAPGKATGAAIWLDEEDHGADCRWRFNDCDDCTNGDVCLIDKDILHMCAAPEHIDPPEHEDT